MRFSFTIQSNESPSSSLVLMSVGSLYQQPYRPTCPSCQRRIQKVKKNVYLKPVIIKLCKEYLLIGFMIAMVW